MPMPISFTWDFNPATILALCGAGLALVKFWLAADQKAAEACRIAKEALEEARSANKAARDAQTDAAERIGILQSALTSYREIQAERLVSREVLREVEDRLAASIEKLGDRLDNLVRELIQSRRSS